MVEIARIEKGIARYLDEELVKKMPSNTWRQFGVGVVSGLIAKRGGTMIEQYKTHPIAKAFSLVDESGCVDIEVLREIASERIPNGGLPVEVPLIGKITVYRSDLESLYKYIVE